MMQDPRDRELQQAIEQFVGAFEVVFDEDWPYGRDHMVHHMHQIIPADGTFLHPTRDPDRVNWGSRAALLQAYERLAAVMKHRGMEPARPVRDRYFVLLVEQGRATVAGAA